jgi:hypothetical protein
VVTEYFHPPCRPSHGVQHFFVGLRHGPIFDIAILCGDDDIDVLGDLAGHGIIAISAAAPIRGVFEGLQGNEAAAPDAHDTVPN